MSLVKLLIRRSCKMRLKDEPLMDNLNILIGQGFNKTRLGLASWVIRIHALSQKGFRMARQATNCCRNAEIRDE